MKKVAPKPSTGDRPKLDATQEAEICLEGAASCFREARQRFHELAGQAVAAVLCDAEIDNHGHFEIAPEQRDLILEMAKAIARLDLSLRGVGHNIDGVADAAAFPISTMRGGK